MGDTVSGKAYVSGGDLELRIVHHQGRGWRVDAKERGRITKRNADRRVDGEHLGGHPGDVRSRLEMVALEHHALQNGEEDSV